MFDYDKVATAYWGLRSSVSLLDVRALHLRPDGHVGSAVNFSHDCLHYCVGTGPLDMLVPAVVMYALEGSTRR